MRGVVGVARILTGVLTICFWAGSSFIFALVMTMPSDDPEEDLSGAELIPFVGVCLVFTAVCFLAAYVLMKTVLEGRRERT